jgi:hypothetical protein
MPSLEEVMEANTKSNINLTNALMKNTAALNVTQGGPAKAEEPAETVETPAAKKKRLAAEKKIADKKAADDIAAEEALETVDDEDDVLAGLLGDDEPEVDEPTGPTLEDVQKAITKLARQKDDDGKNIGKGRAQALLKKFNVSGVSELGEKAYDDFLVMVEKLIKAGAK